MKTAEALVVSTAFVLFVFVFSAPISGASASGGSWATKSPMPTARSYVGAAVANNRIYVVGGTNKLVGSALNRTEEYEPETVNLYEIIDEQENLNNQKIAQLIDSQA